MSGFDRMRRRLRERSEHFLLLAATREHGTGAPGTVAPYNDRSGRLWRWVFVPLYRRVPWEAKQRAMSALRMTASGWKPPERRPREPWRPPPSG
jgi:hypothetical protein